MNEEFENDFDLGFEEVDNQIETENQVESENLETNVDNVEETVDNAEASNEEQEQQAQEEIQKIKLKYNHEEMELPLEEVQVLAQKGMNYDKLQEKLNQVESNPGLQYLNELAERSGTDVEGLVNYWREQERQAELNQLIQNNIPEELASEILENRRYREEQKRLQEEQKKSEAQNQEFKEFFDSFPNVEPNSIPREVWEKNENGVPLKYAYMEYEMDKIKNENNILKNNNQNKKKAVVNSVGNGNDENYDPFLDGFNSY